jgi:CO/xanthine dehydrogenase Mo-binding subunit
MLVRDKVRFAMNEPGAKGIGEPGTIGAAPAVQEARGGR